MVRHLVRHSRVFDLGIYGFWFSRWCFAFSWSLAASGSDSSALEEPETLIHKVYLYSLLVSLFMNRWLQIWFILDIGFTIGFEIDLFCKSKLAARDLGFRFVVFRVWI